MNSSVVFFVANETAVDIHLSSKTIAENATYGTIVGNLSRTPVLANEKITYHVIEEENETQPLEVDKNILKLRLDNSLDYEVLPAGKKHLPISISSVASTSVFTKQFLIEVLGKI